MDYQISTYFFNFFLNYFFLRFSAISSDIRPHSNRSIIHQYPAISIRIPVDRSSVIPSDICHLINICLVSDIQYHPNYTLISDMECLDIRYRTDIRWATTVAEEKVGVSQLSRGKRLELAILLKVSRQGC